MELAALQMLAIIISEPDGAIGEFDRNYFGVYLFKGMMNNKPYYKKLVNQFLYYSSDCKWCVNDEKGFDANKTDSDIRSVESGRGHPSLVSVWEPLEIKVTTIVRHHMNSFKFSMCEEGSVLFCFFYFNENKIVEGIKLLKSRGDGEEDGRSVGVCLRRQLT